MEEDEDDDDNMEITKRSNVVFNPAPSLPLLRNSQSVLRDSSSLISYTPFDDLSEEAICAIFMCLPPIVRFRSSKSIFTNQMLGNL